MTSKIHGKVLLIPCKWRLGLTAKLPKDEAAREFISNQAPVVYSKELLELVGAGIVPESLICNLAVSLNRSERAKYKIFDGIFNAAKHSLRAYIKEAKLEVNEFDLAGEARQSKSHPVYRAAGSFWSAMSMRK